MLSDEDKERKGLTERTQNNIPVEVKKEPLSKRFDTNAKSLDKLANTTQD